MWPIMVRYMSVVLLDRQHKLVQGVQVKALEPEEVHEHVDCIISFLQPVQSVCFEIETE